MVAGRPDDAFMNNDRDDSTRLRGTFGGEDRRQIMFVGEQNGLFVSRSGETD